MLAVRDIGQRRHDVIAMSLRRYEIIVTVYALDGAWRCYCCYSWNEQHSVCAAGHTVGVIIIRLSLCHTPIAGIGCRLKWHALVCYASEHGVGIGLLPLSRRLLF